MTFHTYVGETNIIYHRLSSKFDFILISPSWWKNYDKLCIFQESGNVLNGTCDLLSPENILEAESLPKTHDENKSIINQKIAELPTDMSDTTESEQNIQGK